MKFTDCIINILIFFKFLSISNSTLLNEKCINDDFYKLNFFSNIDENCKFKPLLLYEPVDLGQSPDIRKMFYSEPFIESTNEEIKKYYKQITSSEKVFKKITGKNAEYNSIQVSYGILNKDIKDITDEELYKLDHTNMMTQDSINKLLEKKLYKFQHKPVDFSNPNEKYYQGSISHLYRNYEKVLNYSIDDDTIPPICEGRIDVVWTSVNSTDPEWYKLFQKSSKHGGKNRFREYGSLLFSMRSVYKNLKFIKNWFVVVQSPSQIPKFLDYTEISPKVYKLNYNIDVPEEEKINIHFIFHEDIFPDKRFLPSFASDGIESAFAFMPGLSECFLYLNDDFFVLNKIHPSFFIRSNGKLNLYKSERNAPYLNGNNWDFSVATSNHLLNKEFGFRRRSYPTHTCYFWRKSILMELNRKFKNAFSLTRSHDFRDKTNVVIPFLHSAYSEETKQGEAVIMNKGWFTYYTLKPDNPTWSIFRRIRDKRNIIKCFCINDGYRENNKQTANAFKEFKVEMEFLFPEKLPFEKPYYIPFFDK